MFKAGKCRRMERSQCHVKQIKLIAALLDLENPFDNKNVHVYVFHIA